MIKIEFLVILSIINIPLSLVAVAVIIKLLKDRTYLENELNDLTTDITILQENNSNLKNYEQYWYTRCEELVQELDNYENPVQWGLK